MTNLLVAVRNYLLSRSEIRDVLQGGITFIQVPKENRVYPAIAISLISSVPYNTLEGTSAYKRSCVRVSVQDDMEHFTRGSGLRAIITNVFVGYRGTNAGLLLEGVIETGTELDQIDPDTRCLYFIKDFYVYHPPLS